MAATEREEVHMNTWTVTRLELVVATCSGPGVDVYTPRAQAART
jgi:hypothetical protein